MTQIIKAQNGDLVSLGGMYGRYILRPTQGVTFAHYAFYAHPSEMPEDDGVRYGFHIPAASVKANHGPFVAPRLGPDLVAPLAPLPALDYDEYVAAGGLVQDEFTNLPEEAPAPARLLVAECGDCECMVSVYDYELEFIAEGTLGLSCHVCQAPAWRIWYNGYRLAEVPS